MDLLKKRWIYVLGGFGMFLFMGCSDAWSVFVVPLEDTFGWLRTETSLAYTVKVVCFSVGNILSGILSPRIGYSKVLKTSAIMMGAGFFLSGFATQPWQIMLTYSILCGTAIGMGYNSVVSFAPLWFPEKPGTVTGLLLVGYAVSTALFSPLLNSLIGASGIDASFRLLAVLCFVTIFAGSFLAKSPKAEDSALLPAAKSKASKSGGDVPTGQMIRSPIFWLYFIVSGFFASVGITLLNHASPIMTEELAMDAGTAAIIVSVIAVSNGAGRLFGGVTYDKIGMKKTLAILSLAMAATTVALYTAIVSKSSALFIGAACCGMVLFGVNATTILTIVRELFGSKYFSLNYSIISINAIIYASMPSVIGGIRTATGNYTAAFLMLAGALIATVLLTVLLLRLYSKQSCEASSSKAKKPRLV